LVWVPTTMISAPDSASQIRTARSSDLAGGGCGVVVGAVLSRAIVRGRPSTVKGAAHR
jgi:hypothetical protein